MSRKIAAVVALVSALTLSAVGATASGATETVAGPGIGCCR